MWGERRDRYRDTEGRMEKVKWWAKTWLLSSSQYLNFQLLALSLSLKLYIVNRRPLNEWNNKSVSWRQSKRNKKWGENVSYNFLPSTLLLLWVWQNVWESTSKTIHKMKGESSLNISGRRQNLVFKFIISSSNCHPQTVVFVSMSISRSPCSQRTNTKFH